MRSDQTAAKDFRQSDDWQVNPFTGQIDTALSERYSRGREDRDGRTRWHSFSGHERDCVFINAQGEFKDVSLFSGLDNISDGRAAAVWDIDRDGLRDVALASANYPLLNVYRNRLDRWHRSNFIAIRFQGGNCKPVGTDQFSTRDGYGARVSLRVGGRLIVREHRCGEGFATQNSATMLIGIGNATSVDQLEVHWPSGVVTTTASIHADSLVTAYENVEDNPSKQSFNVDRYSRKTPAVVTTTPTEQNLIRLPIDEFTAARDTPDAELIVLVTMATWCEACHRHQAQFQAVAERHGHRIALLGIPVDPLESTRQLHDYAAEYRPPYWIVPNMSDSARNAVLTAIRRRLDTESIPCTIVTNRAGQVLSVFEGAPTVSDIGKILAR